MKPNEHWNQLVNATMAQRRCTYAEATRIAAAAHPAACTLMSAFGRSRSTVQFFNTREAQKMTPARIEARKKFGEFVNEKVSKGMAYEAAFNSVSAAHPDLVNAMSGAVGIQFVNDAGPGAPVGSPQLNTLFWLPANASQEIFAAAWAANGSTASPLNPAKIFAGLVEWTQKKNNLDYDAAIARVKSEAPRLWEAVEFLSKEPV